MDRVNEARLGESRLLPDALPVTFSGGRHSQGKTYLGLRFIERIGMTGCIRISRLAACFQRGQPTIHQCYMMTFRVITLFAASAMKNVSEPIKAFGQVAPSSHFAEQIAPSSEL